MKNWDVILYLAVILPFCYYVLPQHIFLASIFVVLAVFAYIFKEILSGNKKQNSANPLREDVRRPRAPYIHDQKKRDEVLKQAFSIDKVPKDLDAIVIGSGIGGLTTAAILAKSGKNVLVLEQHDQAGGCCHTFIDKGYEFDVGIHYIGEVSKDRINRTLIDQITEGQVEWEKLDDEFDVVSIGYGDERKEYPVVVGEENWKSLLKKAFPTEVDAIDKYFNLMNESKSFETIAGALKLLPLSLSKLAIRLGAIHFMTKLWRGIFKKRTQDIIESLTENRDLRTIFCYSWGDFGCPPSRSHFLLQALINKHFLDSGGYYPVGGSSEIAFNIIPVIEKHGGKVLVRVDVQRILFDGTKVIGVRVKKGSQQHEILAPVVISSAGAYNTFRSLLPIEAAKKSYFTKIVNEMKPGMGSLSIFLGLNIPNEALKAKKQNIWSFRSNTSVFECDSWINQTEDEAAASDPPFLFISFPSLKDPEWKKHPGRENKSTCAIITFAPWEWFEKWGNRPVKKRGDDYEGFKKSIADNMIEQVSKLFPEIRDHIDYLDIGTPASNKYYLAQPHGEAYGLDHSYERFTPMRLAELRPKTDIPGLYLTGQDSFSCGFTGALFGGFLCAGSVLDRNVMKDLENLHASIQKS